MVLALAASHGAAQLALLELGAVIIGLAVLARIASRWGFSAIPLYMLAGLAFGNGGLLPLDLSESFVRFGAEIGVILLLFSLGLEYTGEELAASLRSGMPAGALDFGLNFLPGFAAGLLLGWGILAGLVLGGVTYVSSSGVIAKVLAELGWMGRPETPSLLSVLVVEDLVMAAYLPILSVLLLGRDLRVGLVSIAVTLIAVTVVLGVALRFGKAISRAVTHQSNEVLLLTLFGLVVLVAGLAQRFEVPAAVGAFLVGIAISGPMVEPAHRLVTPLRDLFAATFFFFFGMEIDPATLPAVLPLAAALGLASILTKLGTGRWIARMRGLRAAEGWRAGALLTARGEFSIVIAGLGVSAGLDARLGPLAAAYVLLTAVAGPLLARWVGGRAG
jgi:CPA2 family monovalent cation:H+ antiporter-2